MSIQSLYGSGVKSWQDLSIDNLSISELSPPTGEDMLFINRSGSGNVPDEYVEVSFTMTSNSGVAAAPSVWTNVTVLNEGYTNDYLPSVIPGVNGYIDFSTCLPGLFQLDFRGSNTNAYVTTGSYVVYHGFTDGVDNLGGNTFIRTAVGAQLIEDSNISGCQTFYVDPLGIQSLYVYSYTNLLASTPVQWAGTLRVKRLA